MLRVALVARPPRQKNSFTIVAQGPWPGRVIAEHRRHCHSLQSPPASKLQPATTHKRPIIERATQCTCVRVRDLQRRGGPWREVRLRVGIKGCMFLQSPPQIASMANWPPCWLFNTLLFRLADPTSLFVISFCFLSICPILSEQRPENLLISPHRANQNACPGHHAHPNAKPKTPMLICCNKKITDKLWPPHDAPTWADSSALLNASSCFFLSCSAKNCA